MGRRTNTGGEPSSPEWPVAKAERGEYSSVLVAGLTASEERTLVEGAAAGATSTRGEGSCAAAAELRNSSAQPFGIEWPDATRCRWTGRD